LTWEGVQLLGFCPEPIRGDYHFRPCHEADLGAVAEIASAVAGVRSLSEESAARWLSRPGSEPELDFLVAEAGDGTVAAYVRIYCDPPRDEPIFMGGVALAHHGRGLGSAICSYAEARAAQMTLATSGEVVLLARVASGRSDTAQLFRSRGYIEARHLLLMRADPSQVLQRLPSPTDFRVAQARVEHAREVYDVLSASFADHWGTSWPTFGAWLHDADGVWLLAWDGPTVVGALVVAPCLVEDENSAQFVELGVLPTVRRGGVASALLRHGLNLVSDWGRTGVGLYMDGESTTGAKQVFNTLGFLAVPRVTYWSRPSV
jgi:mycothiol synthase